MKYLVPLLYLTFAVNGEAQQRVEPSATPLMSVGSAFFGLSVSDIDGSERWYRETFGLTVTMRSPRTDATRSAAVVLQGGGLIVELVKQDEAVPLGNLLPAPREALYVHGIFKVGVFVDNYDVVLAGIRARGVPIVIGPFPDRVDQPANFMIRDNAGNYIQIGAKR